MSVRWSQGQLAGYLGRELEEADYGGGGRIAIVSSNNAGVCWR